MPSIAEKLKHELRQLIPVVLFFFIAFQLLALTEAVMLEQYGIRVSAFLTATFAALVVAKVVLIADHLPLINRFPEKPLIYNVIWKTSIYFLASVAIRYVERLIDSWRHAASFAEANQRLFDEVVWPHFLGCAALAACIAAGLLRASRSRSRPRTGADYQHVLPRSPQGLTA